MPRTSLLVLSIVAIVLLPRVALAACGDGVLDAAETCDDGARSSHDGCSATCTVELGWHCGPVEGGTTCFPACGDRRRLGDERCDDGNVLSGDGCSDFCGLEEVHADARPRAPRTGTVDPSPPSSPDRQRSGGPPGELVVSTRARSGARRVHRRRATWDVFFSSRWA